MFDLRFRGRRRSTSRSTSRAKMNNASEPVTISKSKIGTTDKALAVLRLFSLVEPQWTVEAMAGRLEVPTSTAYRYCRSLAEMGLIVAISAGRYAIGPAVIELDRLARRTDPLLLAAQIPIDELSRIAPENHFVLLSRLYRRQVMCVDQRQRGQHLMDLSYERGRPMPLYRGSVSKVILAHLPARTLNRCFADDCEQIADSGLGADLKTFRRLLKEIRRAGFAVTRAEVDRGVMGISAPVFFPDGNVMASVSLVLPDSSVDPAEFAAMVVHAAHAVTANLRNSSEDEPGQQAGE